MDRQLIKDFLPPHFIRLFRKYSPLKFGPVWTGDYSSWEEAIARSIGYDAEAIIEKVKEASLKVRNGEAVYERDSVVFDHIEYTWPVLAGLLWVFARDKRLDVIDFGGSLGSIYFQNRKFLDALDPVRWSIVEQKKFVEVGQAQFQTEKLRFYPDVETCLKESPSNCILLSSVLPYIESPFQLLARLFTHNIRFLILDKMPFIPGMKDRLTIQKTPASIYEATYPAWFFSEQKFKDVIGERYRVVEEFLCKDEATIQSTFKGMILELKK